MLHTDPDTDLDFETALTVAELIDILDGYSLEAEVRFEGRNEERLIVEVADASGVVLIRGGIPVNA